MELTSEEITSLVLFFGGMQLGAYIWLGVAVSYLRDIRNELRKRK